MKFENLNKANNLNHYRESIDRVFQETKNKQNRIVDLLIYSQGGKGKEIVVETIESALKTAKKKIEIELEELGVEL